MYINREIQETLMHALAQFKCVLITGARQTGKTTLLKHLLENTYNYITLDDMSELHHALESPSTFLAEADLPVIIDEVQLAPELFRQVKFIVDKSDKMGQVILTGSQTYNLMQGVSESLAGRVCILELNGLSLHELAGKNCAHNITANNIATNDASLSNTNINSAAADSVDAGNAAISSATASNIATNSKKATFPTPYVPQKLERKDVLEMPKNFDLWQHIHRGCMPALQNQDLDWYMYYSSYIRTYLERDVRQIVKVKDEQRFFNFMVSCAARTAQLLNISDIAETVGISAKTAHDWLSALEASGIVHILQPFWANTQKRLSKTPKLFFMDTGLACHLTGWNTAEQLKRGAMNGHVFETFVISEILKSYMNAGRDKRSIYFYRDRQKKEIDLVIQDGNVLYGVEVKMGANIGLDAAKHFGELTKFKDFEVGFGHVICQTQTPYMLNENIQAIPVLSI